MYAEYQEHVAYIASTEAKEAYECIVTTAAKSGVFEPRPVPHGYMKKNVTFFDGAQRPYAVVPAKKWILFYLRTPTKTHPGLTLEALQEKFPDASHGQGEEFKIKLYTVVDASRALALMGITDQRVPIEFQSPDEVVLTEELWEGHVKSVTVNAYERSREARFKCIAHHGLNCAVCGMNFEFVYGAIGAGYIHVHHLVSISSIGTQYAVDPVHDLRPVCANCHAMLHTSTPPLSIEELKRNLTNKACLSG